jgi:hypothetical protein
MAQSQGAAQDDTQGLIVEAIEETSTRKGSVRAGRISLEHALRHVVGLAIAKVYNEYGDLIICGVYKSIRFVSDPPTQPRPHALSKQQWCLRIKAIVEKESGRFFIIMTTDGSSDKKETGCSDQWSRKAESRGRGQSCSSTTRSSSYMGQGSSRSLS